MKAYVTGSTGMVGRNVVDHLIADGWDVTVLHRKSSDLSRLDGVNVTFREVDLHSYASVDGAIEGMADCLFHCAANVSDVPSDHHEQYLDNVIGTENLAEAIHRKKAVRRLVHCSTAAVRRYEHLQNTEVARIRSGYIRTKLLAERAIERRVQRGLNAVILRPFIVIGKYDWNSYSQIFTRIQSGQMLFSFPGRLSFCHADAVAHAHLQAYRYGESGSVYHLGGEWTTWHDVFGRIAEIVGVRKPKRLPAWCWYVVAHMNLFWSQARHERPTITPELIDLINEPKSVTDSELIRSQRELGYRPLALDRALADCWEWMGRIR